MAKQRRTKQKKTLRFMDICMIVLLLAGLSGLIYPFFKDSINRAVNQTVISYYKRKTDRQNEANQKEMQAKVAKENKKLAKQGNNPGTDPFKKKAQAVPKTPERKQSYYERNTVGVLYLPTLKTSMPIFGRTNDLLLQQGASLLEGTSQVGGGKDTHSVISAHRGLMDAKLFTDLPDMKQGDVFMIHTNGEKLAYKVRKTRVIKPTEIDHLKIEPGADKVTLMTCTPYMINSHRLLVTGYRTAYPANTDTNLDKLDMNQETGTLKWIAAIALAVMGVILLWAVLYKRRQKKRLLHVPTLGAIWEEIESVSRRRRATRA